MIVSRSLSVAGCTKKLFDGEEAEFIKQVTPGDSDTFSSGVSNSSFEQLLGEVTGWHVNDGVYKSQLSLRDVG